MEGESADTNKQAYKVMKEAGLLQTGARIGIAYGRSASGADVRP